MSVKRWDRCKYLAMTLHFQNVLSISPLRLSLAISVQKVFFVLHTASKSCAAFHLWDYGLPEQGCIIFCLSDNKCNKKHCCSLLPQFRSWRFFKIKTSAEVGQVHSVLLNKRRLWKPTSMLHPELSLNFLLWIPAPGVCWHGSTVTSCRITSPQQISPFMWLVGHQHLQKEEFQRKLAWDTLGGLFQRGAKWLYWCVATGTPALRHCILYNAHLW